MRFIPNPTARTVRPPVEVVDGVLQLFYGPTWPRLKDKAVGELTLPAHAFVDDGAVAVLSSPLGVEVLDHHEPPADRRRHTPPEEEPHADR